MPRRPTGAPAASPASGDTETLVERFARRLRSLSGVVWVAPGGRDEVRQALAAAVDELAPRREDGRPRRVLAWAVEELAALDLAGLLAARGWEYVPWARWAEAETAAGARLRLREASAGADLGITTCAWAAAETGTLALYATPATGRLVSLLPPAHLCLLRPAQIVSGIPEGLRLLTDYAAGHGGPPSTVNLVSGPSRSADIEGDISIGVHGPARLGAVIGDW